MASSTPVGPNPNQVCYRTAVGYYLETLAFFETEKPPSLAALNFSEKTKNLIIPDLGERP